MTPEEIGSSIPLVSKETQRVMLFHIRSLSRADCYQATNVRDLASWVLVQADVPEDAAADWLHGNDLALDSVR